MPSRRAMRGKRVRWFIVLAVLAAAVVPLLPRGTASAHPLGNFTINRYARVEVFRDRLRLHYVLDFAEIPTFQMRDSIDSDGDGAISRAEGNAYVLQLRDTVSEQISLSANGARLDLNPLEQRGDVIPGQAGLETFRAEFAFEAAVPGTGPLAIEFRDRNYSARAGWKEVVVRPSAGAIVTVDQRLLVDASNGLRSYPSGTLSSAPDVREASFSWIAGTGAAAPAIENVGAGRARATSPFDNLLDKDSSVGLVIIALAIAFLLGAQHAFGPGHGKSMVAAYLVGSRGKARHAVALGLTVTATHTSTVYLLGFVTLWATEYIAPERVYLFLGVASGGLVVALGLFLFLSRLKKAYPGASKGAHRHGRFGKAHSHGSVQRHEREGADCGHAHNHGDGAAHAGVSWRSLVTLGISGGLLPCPQAIVVMLAAISFGKVLFGMTLILSFSLGLAFVLSTIGVFLVLGQRFSQRRRLRAFVYAPLVARAVQLMPIVSAAGVTLAGAYITYQAWNQPGL